MYAHYNNNNYILAQLQLLTHMCTFKKWPSVRWKDTYKLTCVLKLKYLQGEMQNS